MIELQILSCPTLSAASLIALKDFAPDVLWNTSGRCLLIQYLSVKLVHKYVNDLIEENCGIDFIVAITLLPCEAKINTGVVHQLYGTNLAQRKIKASSIRDEAYLLVRYNQAT